MNMYNVSDYYTSAPASPQLPYNDNRASGVGIVGPTFFNNQQPTHLDLMTEKPALHSEIEDNQIPLPSNIPNSTLQCDPRVFRCTLSAFPGTNELLDKSKLPLGLMIQPFRDLEIRPVQPTVYLFMLDVSSNAIECGYLHSFVEQLLKDIDAMPGDERSLIGFIAVDANVHFFQFLETSFPPKHLIAYDVDESYVPADNGLIVKISDFKDTNGGPLRLALSYAKINKDGIYLLDTGSYLYLYVCSSVRSDILKAIFDVDMFSKIDEEETLKPLDNPMSILLHEFLADLFYARGRSFAPLLIIRDDSLHKDLFTRRLVEDQTDALDSFVELLQYLKRKVSSN
ncbi:sec23/Sec24 trunk domain-containing protein [Ditylenchus destructor]|uniref:Sec23/Sec24 trunk domain-containing protein n=1 Tax=Ditylenchus destructor TaxID=166010 RepID=A0AAD4RBQ8_9BILA|nr:sec23/Sec24 trunk domain-containing protein [Ditylenchus destructor]